jgi:hypothetical protein
MDARTMPAEASKTEEGKPEPAYRKPTQTRAGRLRKELVDSYFAALGGSATPIMMQDIERAVDLVMLARTKRAELAAGKTTVNDVVKLENAASRAVRALRMPANAAAPVPSIHDYIAANYATVKASEDGEE